MIIERLSRWVMSIRREDIVQVRVFCFAHAGGSASFFRVWASNLPHGMELCAIQLPGREERMGEAACRDLMALIPPLVTELRPYLDRPFALFGHSMGALIAYELARALDSSGRQPVHLFVSGQRAPHLPSRTPLRHTLPQGAFEAALATLDGTPVKILQDPEMMALFTPLLRADFALDETYAWERGSPVDTPITVFSGVDDPEANQQELAAWRTHSRQFRGVRLFPGNHFYLRDNPAPVMAAMSDGLVAPILALD